MFMLVLVFLGLAAAAPHYRPDHEFDLGLDDFHSSFGREFFDPNQFMREFDKEMKQFDDIMKEFQMRFPEARSTAGVVGDQYKVVIPLSGFEEKDIVVKAREGLLIVQATKKLDHGIGKNYIDVRSMPSFVDVAGFWSYENEVLTIAFPVKGGSTTLPTTTVTRGEVEPVTEEPSYSNEEVERTDANKDDNQDADIGLRTEDRDIQTNEISKVPVEATTYAVDLKNQYEFVPVHYKKWMY